MPLRDYYGRIVGAPIDSPMNDVEPDPEEDFDDGDLSRCECVVGCEDISDALAEDEADDALIAEADEAPAASMGVVLKPTSPAEVAQAAGQAIDAAYPWGYRSGDSAP